LQQHAVTHWAWIYWYLALGFVPAIHARIYREALMNRPFHALHRSIGPLHSQVRGTFSRLQNAQLVCRLYGLAPSFLISVLSVEVSAFWTLICSESISLKNLSSLMLVLIFCHP
jgi:hypothetical protein